MLTFHKDNKVMTCLTEIKIRGYHADFYGHVNNARFLEFFEEDRWAHLESELDLGGIARQGLTFLVVNININYRKAVMVGAVLQGYTTIERIGDKSGVLNQKLLFKDSGAVAADALVTFVLADKSGKAVHLSHELLADWMKFDDQPAAGEKQCGGDDKTCQRTTP